MSESAGDELKTTVLYYIATKFAENDRYMYIKECSGQKEKFRAIFSKLDDAHVIILQYKLLNYSPT